MSRARTAQPDKLLENMHRGGPDPPLIVLPIFNVQHEWVELLFFAQPGSFPLLIILVGKKVFQV